MAKYRTKTMRKSRILAWVSLAALVGAGGLYVANPMAITQAIPQAQCWWDDGIFLRATADEGGYTRLMQSNPLNKNRLSSGDARGCYPQGGCIETREEAVKLLEEQMLGWAGVQGGNLLKGNVLGMLGLKSEADARAVQTEADYCFKYLGNHRNKLK